HLNDGTGVAFPYLGGMTWRDANSFVISNGNQYFEYDLQTKKGRKIYEVPAGAENATSDKSLKNIAFTQQNNLFIANATGTAAVTDNADKNIVSGQAIARSEFGIHHGIFWSPKSSYLAFYQKDETDVADYPILDIKTAPGSLQNIKYPMIGQKSEKPKVGVYNMATGKTVFISPRNSSDDYLTNLTW